MPTATGASPPVANCRMAPWSMWWPGTPPATAARRPPSPSTAWRRTRRWSSRATAANSAGLAEPGSSVTLTDGNGNPIGQTTADANGNWSFTPSTPLPDGTVVNVVARDAAGNSSPPASVTVDAVAPATPTVDPSNGTTLSGTAEPGATVTLTDGNGNPIGQVTADGSGNWTFTRARRCPTARWSTPRLPTRPATPVRRPASPWTPWHRPRQWSTRATAPRSAAPPSRAPP
ncbi:putative adhesin [Pseudomonas aeruginosa]|nr:putative adhesin [Pseudomonas aeruginosa]